MKQDLPLRCKCGEFEGMLQGVTPKNSNLLSCYCKDCQSFAYLLESEAETLDPQGGTIVLQLSTARLHILCGEDQLACVRLTENGLMRWHTKCCRTPIGNTLRRATVPFVGIIHSCIERPDGKTVQDVVRPVRMNVNTSGAKGAQSPPEGSVPAVIWFMLRLLVGGVLRRETRSSPFFDHATGAPIRPPRILTPEELSAVEARRDAA